MKINFDYYSADLVCVMEAYTAAIKAVYKDCDIAVRYDEDGDYHNIHGNIDHRNMSELYDLFEKYHFVDCYSKIIR